MTTARKQISEEKQDYGRFKRLVNTISLQKTCTWLRKRNFKRETESLLIAVQNNAVRTNHIKARIDKSQQNKQRLNHQSHNKRMQQISSEGV